MLGRDCDFQVRAIKPEGVNQIMKQLRVTATLFVTTLAYGCGGPSTPQAAQPKADASSQAAEAAGYTTCVVAL